LKGLAKDIMAKRRRGPKQEKGGPEKGGRRTSNWRGGKNLGRGKMLRKKRRKDRNRGIIAPWRCNGTPVTKKAGREKPYVGERNMAMKEGKVLGYTRTHFWEGSSSRRIGPPTRHILRGGGGSMGEGEK